MDHQTRIEMSRVLIENILPNQLEQWAIEVGWTESLELAVQKFERHYKGTRLHLYKMSDCNEWISYINAQLQFLYSYTNTICEATGAPPFEFNMQEAIDSWNERNV